MKFVKDWDNITFFTYEQVTKKVIKAFSRWENMNLKITYGRREKTLEDTYGLPYTSSSGCAMISNTNVEAVLRKEPNYKFEYLAVTEDNEISVVCMDADENEKYIVIGKL